MAKQGPIRIVQAEKLREIYANNLVEDYAKEQEALYWKKICSIAFEIAWNPEIKAVFISGPSSSGKTSTAHGLAKALEVFHKKSICISLDDYYKTVEKQYDANGRPDLESINALDIELLIAQINTLVNGQSVVIPRFDFTSKSSVSDENRSVRMEEDGILIFEGLHSLSDEVIGRLDRKSVIGIFVWPKAKLLGNNAEVLLESNQFRKIRRIVRDHKHRGTEALATLDYWPVINQSEHLLFNVYLKRADYFVNTILPYELFFLPHMASAYLEANLKQLDIGKSVSSSLAKEGVLVDSVEAIAEARRLIICATKLPWVSEDITPTMSILNEFIK